NDNNYHLSQSNLPALIMKHNLVRIAISVNTLASLIESECIHAVDFKCLDMGSKKTVWKLLLSTVKLTHKEKSRI
ncbi:MAG: hypothetical protein ACXV79_15500, partial [Methylobacter sp.]